MIVDKLTNLKYFLPNKYSEPITEFLTNISADMLEGRYEIMGEHTFAKVMSYQTAPREKCAVEAHNRYIDIQATLTGVEIIDIFERNLLNVSKPYDELNDVVFLDGNNATPYASNLNIPGYFSMIYPDEAHRPQIRAEGYPDFVKKFVIKVGI